MKRKTLLVLSATALLALTSCGGKKTPKWEKYVYEDPEVTLSDAETANTQVAFNAVEDNCMVSPKVKAYVDAMEAQEQTLSQPYHFSSLYGPDDYASLAAASDKGDGTTYAPADTGGVDVCQMLNRNDYSNQAENYPIQLTWNNNGLTFESAKLKFWSSEDRGDMREVSLGANATSASLPNLYRARKYRVQLVTDDGKDSQGFEFKTGDYPRTITMGGVNNVRDIGGYVTSYGVKTTQGLIYRGYYIDDKTNGHGKNYNENVEAVNQEVMKIGVELDVQENSTSSGNYGRTTSCLQGADYTCLTLVSYENFLKESSYKNLPAIFDLMANADQKHVYFHCWGGADRTGMLAFFLNAICGVSYTDLLEDFEITTETNNKRCHMHNSSSAHFPKFLNAFINEWDGYDPEKTINENCEKWLLEVPKIDAEVILKIRQLMIPGYYDGMEQHFNVYTAKDEWQTSDLAHWQEANEENGVICNWGRHKAGETCEICGHENDGSSSSSGNESDYNEVLTRVWTKTADMKNSSNKAYEQVRDITRNKVGVRILTKNISAGAFNGDNYINGTVTYKVTAPKAGEYQMIMKGRVADESKKLSERGIVITLNGQEVSINFGDRDGGLNGRGDNDFVICPTINLTGNEDTITVACSQNPVGFAQDSWVLFAEH